MASSTLFLVYVASLGSLSPVILATTTSMMCSGLLFLGQSQLQSCRLRPVGQVCLEVPSILLCRLLPEYWNTGDPPGEKPHSPSVPSCLCSPPLHGQQCGQFCVFTVLEGSSPVSRASFTPLSSGLEDCLLCLGHRHWAWHSSQSPFSNRD